MPKLQRPIVSFATSKGGAGKSTLAIAFAGELAAEGGRVAILDTDPQQSVLKWSKKPNKPDRIDVFEATDEEVMIDLIHACQKTHHVIVIDVQGRVSEIGNTAMAWSDLVVIPLQGAGMDADGAVSTVKNVRKVEKARSAQIAYATVLNRVSGAIRSRTTEAVRDLFSENKIPMLGTVVDREAFRVMTTAGGTQHTLTRADAPGLEKARADTANLTRAIAEQIGLIRKGQGTSASSSDDDAIAQTVTQAGAALQAAQ